MPDAGGEVNGARDQQHTGNVNAARPGMEATEKPIMKAIGKVTGVKLKPLPPNVNLLFYFPAAYCYQ
ncbi:MAG: hypothetical protein ACREQP_06365 [Candidatus Binatia bacterium]